MNPSPVYAMEETEKFCILEEITNSEKVIETRTTNKKLKSEKKVMK